MQKGAPLLHCHASSAWCSNCKNAWSDPNLSRSSRCSIEGKSGTMHRGWRVNPKSCLWNRLIPNCVAEDSGQNSRVFDKANRLFQVSRCGIWHGHDYPWRTAPCWRGPIDCSSLKKIGKLYPNFKNSRYIYNYYLTYSILCSNFL